MKGYALEMRLIKWTCSCEYHSPSGMCYATESFKEEAVRTVYRGSFFYGLETEAEIFDKFDTVKLVSKGIKQ